MGHPNGWKSERRQECLEPLRISVGVKPLAPGVLL
jgi:hypothetical protein